MSKDSWGTGSVYKPKGTSRWWVRYHVRGKLYRESSGSTKKKDAADLLKKRLAEQGAGKFIGPKAEKVTFARLAKLMENDYRMNGRPWNRATLDVGHLRAYFGGDCRAIDITTARLTEYVLHRQEEGAANATIKHELSALGRMFTLAVDLGELQSRPALPNLKVSNTRTGFLDGDELEAVIRELAPPLRPVVRFASLTGWRKMEILRLTWARVDFDAGVIRLEVGSTKNEEGRTFPFAVLPQLVELLETQRAHTREVERRTGSIVTHVFHRDGHPIKSMTRGFRGACKRAGVPGAILHDLRRTGARNLIRAGVPEKTAMTLLGHKTRSIFDRYNIITDADQREGIAKLAQYLAGRSTEPRKVIPIQRAADG